LEYLCVHVRILLIMELKELGRTDVDLIHLTQNKNQPQALVHTIINVWDR
jgi:hypothetical protein